MKELEQRLLALLMAGVTAVSLPASVVMNPVTVYANTSQAEAGEEDSTISVELSFDPDTSKPGEDLAFSVSEEMRAEGTVKLQDVLRKLNAKYGTVYGLSSELVQNTEHATESDVAQSDEAGVATESDVAQSDDADVATESDVAQSDEAGAATEGTNAATGEGETAHATGNESTNDSSREDVEKLNCTVRKKNGYLEFRNVKWKLSEDRSESTLDIMDGQDTPASYEFVPDFGDVDTFSIGKQSYQLDGSALTLTVTFVSDISYDATASFDLTYKDNFDRYASRPEQETVLSHFVLKAEVGGNEAGEVRLSEVRDAEDLPFELETVEALDSEDTAEHRIAVKEEKAAVTANQDPKNGQKIKYTFSGFPSNNADGEEIHYSIALDTEQQVEEQGKTYVPMEINDTFINPDELITAQYALSGTGNLYQAVLQGTTRIYFTNEWFDEGSDEVKAARPTLKYSPYRYLDTGNYSYATASPYWGLGKEKLGLPEDAKMTDAGEPSILVAENENKIAASAQSAKEDPEAFTDAAFDESGVKYIYLLKQHKTESGQAKGVYTTYYANANEETGTVTYAQDEEPKGSFIPNGASVYQLIKGQKLIAHTYQFKAAAHPNVNAVITAALSKQENGTLVETGKTESTREFSEEHTREELKFSADRYDAEGKTIGYGLMTKSMTFRGETEAKPIAGQDRIYDNDGYAYEITESTESSPESTFTNELGEEAEIESTGTTTFTLVGNEIVHVKQVISGKIENLRKLEVRYGIRADKNEVWSGILEATQDTAGSTPEVHLRGTDADHVSPVSYGLDNEKHTITIEFDVSGTGAGQFPQYDEKGNEITYTVGCEIVNYNDIAELRDEDIAGPDADHKDALKKDGEGHRYGQHDEVVRFYLGQGPTSVIRVKNDWKVGPNRSARKDVTFEVQYYNEEHQWEPVSIGGKTETTIPAQTDYIEVSIPGDLSKDITEEINGQKNYAKLWQLASASVITENGSRPEYGAFRIVETSIGGVTHTLSESANVPETDETAKSILNANPDLSVNEAKEIVNANFALVNCSTKDDSAEEDEYFYIQEVASKEATNVFRLRNRRVGVARMVATVVWKDDNNRLNLRPDDVQVLIKSGEETRETISLAGKSAVVTEAQNAERASGIAGSLFNMFAVVRNGVDQLIGAMLNAVGNETQEALPIVKSRIFEMPKYDEEGAFVSYSMEVSNQDSHYTGTAGQYYFKQRFLNETSENDAEDSEARIKNGFVQEKKGLSFDTYQFDLVETLSGKVTPVFHILWKGDPKDVVGQDQFPDIYSTLYRKVLTPKEEQDAELSGTDASAARNIDIAGAENLGTKNHDYENKGYTVKDGAYTALWIDTYNDLFDRYDADGKEYTYFEVINTTKSSEYKISGGYKDAPASEPSEDVNSTDGKRHSFDEETHRSYNVGGSSGDIYAAPYKAKQESLSNDQNAGDNAEANSAVSGTIVIRPMTKGLLTVNKSWSGNVAADNVKKIYPSSLAFSVQGSMDGTLYTQMKENTIVSDVYRNNQKDIEATTVTAEELQNANAAVNKITVSVPKYDFDGRKYRSYRLSEQLPENVENLYFRNAEKTIRAVDAGIENVTFGGSTNVSNVYKPDQGYTATITVHWKGLTPEDLEDGTPSANIALLQYRSGENPETIDPDDRSARRMEGIRLVTPDGVDRGSDADGHRILQGTAIWEHLPKFAPDGKPYIYRAIEVKDDFTNGYSVYEGTEEGSEKSTSTVAVENITAYPDGESTSKAYNAHSIGMVKHLDDSGEDVRVQADFINAYNDAKSKNALGDVTIQLHWPSLLFELDNAPKKANRPAKVGMELYRIPGSKAAIEKPADNAFPEEYDGTAIRSMELKPKKDDKTWEAKAKDLRIYDPSGKRYIYGVKLSDDSRRVLTASNEILVNYGISSELQDVALAFSSEDHAGAGTEELKNANITSVSLSEDSTTLTVKREPIEGDALGIGQSVNGYRVKLQYRVVDIDANGQSTGTEGWKDVKTQETVVDRIVDFFRKLFGNGQELEDEINVLLNEDNGFEYTWTNLPVSSVDTQIVEYRAVEMGLTTEAEEIGNRTEEENSSDNDAGRFDVEVATVGGFRSIGTTAKERPSSVGHYRFTTVLQNELPVAALDIRRQYLNEAKDGASDATLSELENTEKLRFKKMLVHAMAERSGDTVIFATASELSPEAGESADWKLEKLPTVDASGSPITYQVLREEESDEEQIHYFSVCTSSELDENDQPVANEAQEEHAPAVQADGAMSGAKSFKLRANHTVQLAFTDTLARADLHFKKVNEDAADQALAGSTYELSRKTTFEDMDHGHSTGDTKVVARAVTDDNGEIVFKDLVVGVDYILQEAEAPEGYRISKEPVAFRSDLQDDLATTSELRMDGDTVIGVKDYFIGAMKMIAVGTFDTAAFLQLEESKQAEAFRISPVSIGEDGSIQWNEPPIRLSIEKRGESEQGALLGDARLELRHVIPETETSSASEITIASWSTVANLPTEVKTNGVVSGETTVALAEGETYRLYELEAPAGYQMADPVEFTISRTKAGSLVSEDDTHMVITMIDRRVPSPHEDYDRDNDYDYEGAKGPGPNVHPGIDHLDPNAPLAIHPGKNTGSVQGAGRLSPLEEVTGENAPGRTLGESRMEEEKRGRSAKTGDRSHMVFYGVMCLASSALLGMYFWLTKAKKKQNEA